MRVPAFLVALALSGGPSVARATSVVYVTDVEQASLADAVVLGHVEAQRVEMDTRWNRPVTISTVRVEETIAGFAPDRIEVHQFGGAVDGLVSRIPGDAALVAGERVVLFVNLDDFGWRLTALEQSKYRVDRLDRWGEVLVRPRLTASLYSRGEDGALQPIAEPPRKPIYTLDELRRKIGAGEGIEVRP